jgi:hypothetical protein
VNDIDIRPAKDSELGTVAELRWQWILENGGTPVTTRDEFVHHFVRWAQENAFSHRCMVVVRGDIVIGMAWLAIIQRVPTPRALERASGDVQCVYIVPDERDTGLGGRLIDMVLELAHFGVLSSRIYSVPSTATSRRCESDAVDGQLQTGSITNPVTGGGDGPQRRQARHGGRPDTRERWGIRESST